jgi:hypothetical protein
MQNHKSLNHGKKSILCICVGISSKPARNVNTNTILVVRPCTKKNFAFFDKYQQGQDNTGHTYYLSIKTRIRKI